MKKITKFLALVCISAIICTGCFGGKYSNIEDYSEFAKEYAGYDTFYTVDTFPFALEQTDYVELFQEAYGLEYDDYYALNLESSWGKEYYKITNSSYSEYLYYGELKDNMPHGEGVLFELGDLYYVVSYIGEFKKGQFHGDGIDFGEIYGDFYQVLYEGEFEKGKYSGEGVQYYVVEDITNSEHSTVREEMLNTIEVNNVAAFPLQYSSISGSGTFVDDQLEGEENVMYYPDGNVLYKGETREGNIHGEGIVYYQDGSTYYEGEFSDGKFDGKGVLYDENGEVKYKGKFKNGDYK